MAERPTVLDVATHTAASLQRGGYPAPARFEVCLPVDADIARALAATRREPALREPQAGRDEMRGLLAELQRLRAAGRVIEEQKQAAEKRAAESTAAALELMQRQHDEELAAAAYLARKLGTVLDAVRLLGGPAGAVADAALRGLTVEECRLVGRAS
jgi:hypothetical protein